MAEIVELIAADHLHIMRWQVRLAELRHRPGEPGDALPLTAIWDTLASLIDLHMAADEEVCGPAVYGSGPAGLELVREVAGAHEGIREIIRETGRYPAGSPRWWDLATAALAAWTRCLHREVLRTAGRLPASHQPGAARPAGPPVAGLHGHADPRPVPGPFAAGPDLQAPPDPNRRHGAAPGRSRLRPPRLRLPGLYPGARPASVRRPTPSGDSPRLARPGGRSRRRRRPARGYSGTRRVGPRPAAGGVPTGKGDCSGTTTGIVVIVVIVVLGLAVWLAMIARAARHPARNILSTTRWRAGPGWPARRRRARRRADARRARARGRRQPAGPGRGEGRLRPPPAGRGPGQCPTLDDEAAPSRVEPDAAIPFRRLRMPTRVPAPGW